MIKVRWKRFWIKCFNYEYWHWLSLYVLILPYLLWLIIRARSYRYFLDINPSFERGGFQHYSKKKVLDLIPAAYKPTTFLATSTYDFLDVIKKNDLQFPLIAKPDMGERGKGVVKIGSATEAVALAETIDCEHIIQDFVDYPLEIGVFYSRLPSEAKGEISSVTLKEFLHVIGNGNDTLQTLILRNNRALFQYEKLEKRFANRWQEMIAEGEKITLEGIGNHNRGTRFINANYLINNDLENIFEKISRQIQGFQYGRYDVRVSSLEDLYEGKNIMIMELNGTNSEPTHIYDGSVGLIRACRDLAWHWRRMAEICRENMLETAKP
jgi:RimK-like ATP-grasp domain